MTSSDVRNGWGFFSVEFLVNKNLYKPLTEVFVNIFTDQVKFLIFFIFLFFIFIFLTSLCDAWSTKLERRGVSSLLATEN